MIDDLSEFVRAARPHVAGLMRRKSPFGADATTPNQRVSDGFASFSPMPQFNPGFMGAASNVQAQPDPAAMQQSFNGPAGTGAPLSLAPPQSVAVPGSADAGHAGQASAMPWAGAPWSGFLDAMNEKGQNGSSALVPKFVNLMGRLGSQ